MTAMPREFAALKQLLDAWHVSELFEHFQAEDINVEELQLMNYRHIELALQHFRLGTRIRFEHHLQQWRQDLHQPLTLQLQCAASGAPCQCQCAAQNYAATHATDLQNATMSRSATPTNEMPPEPLIALTEVELSQLLPKYETSDYNLPKMPQLSHANQVIERLRPEDSAYSTVTVKEILASSGAAGVTLLNFRSENKPLTTAQRNLLIQLIVSYFEDNQVHLTLHKSHMLEREILHLFPCEQLHEYRTERRGKIYTKFVNRYKKPSKRHQRYEWVLKPKNDSTMHEDEFVPEAPPNLTNWKDTFMHKKIKLEDNFEAKFYRTD